MIYNYTTFVYNFSIVFLLIFYGSCLLLRKRKQTPIIIYYFTTLICVFQNFFSKKDIKSLIFKFYSRLIFGTIVDKESK